MFCAINATQIKVVFSEEVDSTTAIAVASYKVNGVNTTGTPVLQSDNKTVIITYAGSQDNTSATVKVTGVKSKDLTETIKDFTETVTFADIVAPIVTKAEYVGGKVVLTFSEPIQAAPATFRVNGNPVAVAFVAGSTTKVEATVALTASTTATIYAAGVKDIAGNDMALYNGSVAVPAADTIKPTIASVKQVGENKVRVVFSEVLGATTSDLQDGELKFFKDAALNTTNSTVLKNTTLDPSGKTYDVTFVGTEIYGTPAKDSVTVTLVLAKDAVKDAANNGNDAFTQSFTFTADKTGPVLVSSKIVSPANTNVEFTFDEAISTAVLSKIIVTDAEGVRVNPTSAAQKAGVGNEKIAEVVFGAALANGTYTFNFQADAVTDANSNKSLAFTTTVIVGDSADITKPVAAIANKPAVKNTFTVGFGEEVTSTALNLANYKLDGAALPTGTDIYFTSAAKDTVEIVLPAGSVNIGDQSTGANAVLSVSNVADKAGNIVKNTSATVVINDNTAATIESVQVIGQDVYVTFSEAVTVTASTDIADVFTLKDGTTDVVEATGKYIAAVSGNAKQVKFTLTSALTDTLTVKVKTAQTVLTDANGVAVK